ncbi:unnamed protein product [Urochloa decumbens]|uniref:Uncharacterized protein n=1 Tax=Urochloa decumbens TaxID=240449 RepID=A0ABC9AUA3_9POAL
MEAMQMLLTVALALLVFLSAASFRRGSSKLAGDTRRTHPATTTIQVRDAAVARRMIFDDADSFSNHPAAPFPVDLDAGHHKTTSINSAPYGQLWRALRRNLTAGVLHPSRLVPLLAPLHRAAAAALVANLNSSLVTGAGEVVIVRDALYDAVFGVTARLCFGDDAVGGGAGERAMREALREFFHSGIDAGVLARSRAGRLLRWRQWRYLAGTRRRLAELFAPAIIAARRRSRCRAGGVRSYVDTLLDVCVPAGESAVDRRRELRDDEIVRLVWEFLGAGTLTVVACVEWTLARLVASPEVQDKLRRELIDGTTGGDHRDMPPYLRAVILESLRLHPPVPFILRDAVIGPDSRAEPPPPPDGSPSPVRFTFMAEEIGRDGKAWKDPEEFIPERFLTGGEGEDVGPVPGTKEIKMMPFGAGRRHCPGAGLAMAHAGCFVETLVREFNWAPPDGGGVGVDLTATHALFIKVMASPLRARITPRKEMLAR